MKENLTVDRIEEDIAVCEKDSERVEIKLSLLPENVKEGDILVFSEDGKYIIDEDKTESKRKEMNKLLNSLWN